MDIDFPHNSEMHKMIQCFVDGGWGYTGLLHQNQKSPEDVSSALDELVKLRPRLDQAYGSFH